MPREGKCLAIEGPWLDDPDPIEHGRLSASSEAHERQGSLQPALEHQVPALVDSEGELGRPEHVRAHARKLPRVLMVGENFYFEGCGQSEDRAMWMKALATDSEDVLEEFFRKAAVYARTARGILDDTGLNAVLHSVVEMKPSDSVSRQAALNLQVADARIFGHLEKATLALDAKSQGIEEGYAQGWIATHTKIMVGFSRYRANASSVTLESVVAVNRDQVVTAATVTTREAGRAERLLDDEG